jgi:hypothetical protein
MNFKSNYKKLTEFVGVLAVILSGFIVTAVFKLNNFFTFPSLDEMLWHLRSRVFWDKMLEFDFSGLIQSSQPGITVYWFTGFLMKFIDFDFTYVSRLIAEKEAEGLNFNNVVNVNDPVIYSLYEPISFAFNAPLFLLTILFCIAFYYLLRKLGFNKFIAFFSLLFLVTNIFLVYYTTPSDKMLNIFITLSFLTFLVYINKLGGKKYLCVSAVFGSWAVLSKLSALFILPFFAFIFIFYRWPLEIKKIKSIITDYFLWILIFSLVSVIFLPSIITNPDEVYKLVFKLEHIVETDYRASSYFSRLSFDYLKSLFIVMFSYMAQGATLSAVAYFVLKLSKKYRGVFSSLPSKHIKAISAYVALFVIMVTLMSSNHDIRFMSPAFVMFNVISAAGLYGVVKIVTKKNKLDDYNKKVFYAALFLVIVLSQILFITSSGLLMEEVVKKFF